MTRDSTTIDVYNRMAVEYADLVGSDGADLALAEFIGKLPAGSRVLDLGCGPGGHSFQMLQAGLDVLSTDASSEMAVVAKQRFEIDVRPLTFDDIDHVSEFDGIWASFCLLHAPRSAMPRHLTSLHRALRSDGQLFIGLKTGTGEHRDALGRLYTYYTEPEICSLLHTAGFHVTCSKTGEGPGLDGNIAPWVTVTAHA